MENARTAEAPERLYLDFGCRPLNAQSDGLPPWQDDPNYVPTRDEVVGHLENRARRNFKTEVLGTELTITCMRVSYSHAYNSGYLHRRL